MNRSDTIARRQLLKTGLVGAGAGLGIVSSHLIKYPYSFYALAKDVRDDALKQRILDQVYHLTAMS